MTKAPMDAVEIERIRETIIEAAVGIIHRTGFQGLTMRKIAGETGMSATNLYNYFSNKDEIYINILIRGFRLLHDELESSLHEETDPVAIAKRFAGSYLSFGINNYHYYEIMFSPGLPKYADYAGSPLEELARVELDYSKKIIDLAFHVMATVMGAAGIKNQDMQRRRMIEIWCMLHGMISLRNSTLIDYAVTNTEELYRQIIDKIISL